MTKPYLYQVEYIESTGTQYIDTGFTGDQNTRIKFDFQLTDINSIRAVFGSRTYNGTTVTRGRYFYPILGEHIETVDRFQLGYAADLYRVENISTPNARYVIDLDKNVVKLNGVVQSTFTTATFTNPSSILLFNCHTGSSGTELDTRYAKVKVYSCQIWNNGVIVRDYIPVVDNEMIPALYDRVNGVMYYNRGTGQFNFGSIVTSKSGKSPLRRKLAGVLSNLKKKRPYYCEVEYLESTGTQYIDTGVIGNGEFDVDYIYRQTQESLNAIFAGTRSASQHLNFGQRSTGSGGGFSLAYLGNFWIAGSTPSINLDIRVQISYKSGSQSGSLNGTALTGNTLTGTEATNLSIYLFKRNHYGTDNVDGLVGRIYYFKLWKDGTLVRDFIPVLDWNMTPCMYDKVTGQLFYNQGTGDFTYGREIHYVDYLEGTGTQYIDTGFKPNQDTKVEVIGKFKTTYPSCLYATRWSGSPTYDTYGCYAEPTGLYSYYGRYSDGFVVGVPDSEFNYKDSWLSLIQDKNNLNYTNLETNASWTYSFNTTTFQSTSKLYLFHFYTGTSFATNGGYIKSCKIWDDGTLVRDYKPAIDENGVGFMFDRITHAIYDNAGTGVFKYPARELEYIESTGTQYIYTGIDNWNNTLQFEMKCSIQQQAVGNKSWFGCYNSWTNGSVMPGIGTYTNYRVMNNFNTGYQASSGTDIGIANGQVGIYKLSEDSLSWSVGSAIAFDRSREFTNDTPCILFGTYYSGGPKEFASFKMYYFKFWLNGGLVRDFIPVFQDGVAGMLDKVNDVFYDNDGTGDFLVGRVKEEEYE